jgi:hypothetical protein
MAKHDGEAGSRRRRFSGPLNSNPAVPRQLGHTYGYGASVHNLYHDGALDRVRMATGDRGVYPLNGNANDVGGLGYHGVPYGGVDFSVPSEARFDGVVPTFPAERLWGEALAPVGTCGAALRAFKARRAPDVCPCPGRPEGRLLYLRWFRIEHRMADRPSTGSPSDVRLPLGFAGCGARLRGGAPVREELSDGRPLGRHHAEHPGRFQASLAPRPRP